jgi:diaminopimelate epimerase
MNFAKLQGTGNDFIIIDARNIERDWSGLARDICHRYLGAGADGLMLVLSSANANLKMRLFNSDGSEAEVSGNGLRCFAKYVIDRRIVTGTNLTVETMSGIRVIDATVSVGKVTHARVNMGIPLFKAKEIPVLLNKPHKGRGEVDIKQVLDYHLTVGGKDLNLSFVSMGNPHAVSFLSQQVADFPLAAIGPKIENHSILPERVNFEIARILTPTRIEARVWERGVGETLSCGTGACAIAVISRLKGYSGNNVDIILPGGELAVSWDGKGEVYLSGSVGEVFTGEWPK